MERRNLKGTPSREARSKEKSCQESSQRVDELRQAVQEKDEELMRLRQTVEEQETQKQLSERSSLLTKAAKSGED